MSSVPRLRTLLRAAILCAALLAVSTLAFEKSTTEPENLLQLSIPDLDLRLKECPFVQELNTQRHAALPETSSLLKRAFAVLFPGSPAVNSLLATAYISGPPSTQLFLLVRVHG